MLNNVRAAQVFGIVTLLIWGVRIRNVLDDAELTGAERVWSFVPTFAFTIVGALVVLVVYVRALQPYRDRVVGVSALITLIYWPLRLLSIAFGGHSVAFVIVHLVLGIILGGLAWLARTSRTGVSPV